MTISRLTSLLSCLLPSITRTECILRNKINHRKLFSVVEDIDSEKYESNALTTNLNVDTGSYGIMFDIMSLKELVMFDISFYTDVTFELNFELYLKEGTYFTSRSNKDDWTMMASGTKKGAGKGTPTSSSGFKPIKLEANKVVGVYLTLDSYDMRHSTTKLNMGDVANSNGDLMIEVGSGVESYPLGNKFTQPRLFRGAIKYFDPNANVVGTDSPTEVPTSKPTDESTLAPTKQQPKSTPAPTSTQTALSTTLQTTFTTDPPLLPTNGNLVKTNKNLKLVEGCTKQLMYLQGDNLGVITADNIVALEKIIWNELNKLFSKNVDKAQIISVKVADQLFDPDLPRDITIVTLILGEFPNVPDFVFDTEVQKMFDVISPNVLIQLKDNIYRYTGVTEVFSVIDWHLNVTEVHCGKKDGPPTSQLKAQEPNSGLSAIGIALISVAVFIVCICIPGCVIQYKMNSKNEDKGGLEEYTDDTIARLAELYAKSAYSAWSDDGRESSRSNRSTNQ